MQLSFHLFILLLGFVFGNLFPTFFGDFLGKVGTPLFLFLALDFFNYFYYTNAFSKTVQLNRRRGSTDAENGMKQTRSKIQSSESEPTLRTTRAQWARTSKAWSCDFGSISFIPKSSFSSRANSLKIGFLFGLFVDAFKVGS